MNGIFRRFCSAIRRCGPAAALTLSVAVWLGSPAWAAPVPPPTVMVLVGAPGEPEFATNFISQAATLESLCRLVGARFLAVGMNPPGAESDRDILRLRLSEESSEPDAELWLVMIGHGTFDGKEARFNLRGPDVSSAELATWLAVCRRPMVLVNAASCSAPFLKDLAGTNRVVITATRSGSERSATHFGGFFVAALGDPQGDLDSDGQVSALEAFLSASAQVAEWYKSRGQLATEHALIDDNGDGLGTPGDWFRGVRATKRAKDGSALDGARAGQRHLLRSGEDLRLTQEQRLRRDALEIEIARLRETKGQVPADDYFRRMESLLLELAGVYEQGPGR